MKHSKKCPKCLGENILKIETPPMKYRYSAQIPVGITVFSAVSVPRYICCTCGYSEEWINEEDIPTLLDKYPRYF